MPTLYAVTSFFNPFNSKIRVANLQRVIDSMARQGVPLLIVECMAPGQAPVFEARAALLQVMSNSILWQKESLINLALSRLPDDCNYVAWLDADILFEDDDWAEQSIRLLQTHAVIQLFSEVTWLEPGQQSPSRDALWTRSFAAQVTADPALAATDFQTHGHTGFGWAMRRSELCDVRLFDGCIVGGGDHVMGHAFTGKPQSHCVERLLGANSPLMANFIAWSDRVSRVVGHSLGVRDGRIAHLWHGSLASRRYLIRNLDLNALGFDPDTDLARDPLGLWEWRDEAAKTARYVQDYMRQRHDEEEQI